MKKKVLLVLIIAIFLLSGVKCFAVSMIDFQGKWVAKYIEQSGIRYSVEDFSFDATLEISSIFEFDGYKSSGADSFRFFINQAHTF